MFHTKTQRHKGTKEGCDVALRNPERGTQR
jgi:hypothetical protein